MTIRDLVKNCLRMRPDRIVVGECRGGEALDMLQAMNTGHDGSLTTIHANTPRDCLSRIEVLVLMSGMELPVQAIREQITSAIDIIVQQTRFSCGSRKVTSITEVNGIEAGVIQLSEIFRFAHSGYGPDGKVNGEFVSTGNVPDFVGLRQRNVKIDMRLFNNVQQPQDLGHDSVWRWFCPALCQCVRSIACDVQDLHHGTAQVSGPFQDQCRDQLG